MALRLIILFGIILLIEFLFHQLFPDWEFINGVLTISNKLLLYYSILTMLFCLARFFKVNKVLTSIMGSLFFIYLILVTITEIYPMDTTTEPVDIKTLRIENDKRKLIVRQYENAKTNRIIHDTVLVKDIFIFRRIY